MSLTIKKKMGKISAKNLGIRLIITTILGLFILTGYFVSTGYSNYISNSEDGILRELSAIAVTTAFSIDGDRHEKLLNTYLKKDDITISDQDTLYKEVYEQLIQVKQLNNIGSDIYTLYRNNVTSNNDKTSFYFGVTSGKIPYYRHPYTSYPEELKEHFERGAKIHAFEDNHGTWLSAFAPIKNSKGDVVAVIQVDRKFDIFISEARSEALKELGISLIVFLLLTGIILYIIRQIILEDNDNKEALQKAYLKVEKQNKSITDSINYARTIQSSIVPNEITIQNSFKDAFMFYKAKDVVSGDFPWLFKKGNDIYIAAVDCTGHGVPGAMMSFIGYFLLNEINGHKESLKPSVILDKLHEGVVDTLKQNDIDSKSRDGMDVALCKIDLGKKEIQYAGAHRPLYYMNNNGLEEFKGDRKAIGGRVNPKKDKPFTNYTVNINEDEAIYFFSDGLPDQFGGDGIQQKKYSARRIRSTIEENHGKNMSTIKEIFSNDFNKWQGNTKQIDDVLMIGIQF